MDYRQIYKEHHGPIPFEPDGRSYEIHHRDGNHANNAPNNLMAVSIQEHYDIHYAQKDYGACYYIAQRMYKSSEELSKLARISNLIRVNNGTHNFLDGTASSTSARKRLMEGTHQFANSEFQSAITQKRVKDGTHNFLGGKIQSETQKRLVTEGKHSFQQQKLVQCPYCFQEFRKCHLTRHIKSKHNDSSS